MQTLLQTVYSDSTKHFVSKPYPRKGDTIQISLRVKENPILQQIFLRYKKQGVEIVEEMTKTETLNGLAYYQADALCLDDYLSYQFYLTTKEAIYFYTQAGISDYLPDDSHNFKIYTDYDAPEWLSQTVFYQIMPDRFANGRPEIGITAEQFTYNGKSPKPMRWEDQPLEYADVFAMDFYGGDLWGIIDHLDYLQELGVNGIYLNPIFTSPTHHKYDALDYFEIDPSLGGEEALIALSQAIHHRGMKLVLDISINHTSSSSKWFNKTCEFYDKSVGAYHNPDAPEREFFFIDEQNNYKSWFGLETMPQLNYGSQRLRDIIYRNEDSVLKKYLKEPFNIDGWRFDVADVMARNDVLDVYHEVWREIYQEIKATKKDAAIIAEEWADAWEMYDAKQWDSTMNYFQAARPLREFAGTCDLFLERQPDLAKINYPKTARHLGRRILQFMTKVPSQIQYQMFNLINSHDVPRLYHMDGVAFAGYQGASICLFGLPGATNIWYGDEQLLGGHHKSNEGTRYPMNWSRELTQQEKDCYQLYQTLCRLKTTEESLQTGGFRILRMTEQVIVFARFTREACYLFVWSQSEQEEQIDITALDLGMTGADWALLVGDSHVDSSTERLKLIVPAKGSAIISGHLCQGQ